MLLFIDNFHNQFMLNFNFLEFNDSNLTYNIFQIIKFNHYKVLLILLLNLMFELLIRINSF